MVLENGENELPVNRTLNRHGPVITWIDNNGDYRVTSPNYNSPVREDWTDADVQSFVWAQCRNLYKLSEDHVCFIVEHEVQLAAVARIGGAGTWLKGGVCNWELSPDGTPRLRGL